MISKPTWGEAMRKATLMAEVKNVELATVWLEIARECRLHDAAKDAPVQEPRRATGAEPRGAARYE